MRGSGWCKLRPLAPALPSSSKGRVERGAWRARIFSLPPDASREYENLGLEAAGIAYSAKGIEVNARLRTSNRRVYAVGDVIGGPQFTHLAAYHAGIVIRNALFRLPAKVDLSALPWVTYTDPELAHVGLSEASARERGPIQVLRWPFAEKGAGQGDHFDRGSIKVVATPTGRILGADIVGPGAGEMIPPLDPCGQRAPQDRCHGWHANVPYPNLSEVGNRAISNFFSPKLFSNGKRRLVRMLARLG